MRVLAKTTAAFVLGAAALGLSAASADDKEKGFRSDDERYEDGRYDGRLYDDGRYDDQRYYGDRGGRYYDRWYCDRRGYRDHGRILNREIFRLRGYRADAILVEEVYYGRRGGPELICTVTARGPDARYVPYGQLRRIAVRECSRHADIRIHA